MIGFVISDRPLLIDGVLCKELSEKFKKHIYFTEYKTEKGMFVSIDEVIDKGIERCMDERKMSV